MENKLFDVVIVGASKSGRAICKGLSKVLQNKKVAIISKAFNTEDKHLKNSKVECIIGNVKFLTYNHGLIGLVYDENSSPTIFCKQLVVATGFKTENTLTCHGANAYGIYTSFAELPVEAKRNACIILGSTKKAFRIATQASSKFSKVYFWPGRFSFPSELKQKLNAINTKNNITTFFGGMPTEIFTDDKNNVKAVIFDTDNIIDCDAIFVAMQAEPDTDWIPSQFFFKDESGYLQVNDSGQSTRIPTVYACGEVLNDNKNLEQAIIKTIAAQKTGGR